MSTTTKILFIIIIIFIIACVSLILALVRKTHQYEALLDSVTPYNHWASFSDGSYAIPLTTKLYQKGSANLLEPIGTVADHFEDFSKSSLEESLDEAYYGAKLERGYIPVKIISIDTYSSSVGIQSITGQRFFVNRNDEENFPSSVRIKVPAEKKTTT